MTAGRRSRLIHPGRRHGGVDAAMPFENKRNVLLTTTTETTKKVFSVLAVMLLRRNEVFSFAQQEKCQTAAFK
jgi:hypothetical protein